MPTFLLTWNPTRWPWVKLAGGESGDGGRHSLYKQVEYRKHEEDHTRRSGLPPEARRGAEGNHCSERPAAAGRPPHSVGPRPARHRAWDVDRPSSPGRQVSRVRRVRRTAPQVCVGKAERRGADTAMGVFPAKKSVSSGLKSPPGKEQDQAGTLPATTRAGCRAEAHGQSRRPGIGDIDREYPRSNGPRCP